MSYKDNYSHSQINLSEVLSRIRNEQSQNYEKQQKKVCFKLFLSHKQKIGGV